MDNHKALNTGTTKAHASARNHKSYQPRPESGEFEPYEDQHGAVSDVGNYSKRMADGFIAHDYGAHELDVEFNDRDSFGSAPLASELQGEEFHDGMFSVMPDADDDEFWDAATWDDEDADFR